MHLVSRFKKQARLHIEGRVMETGVPDERSFSKVRSSGLKKSTLGIKSEIGFVLTIVVLPVPLGPATIQK